MIASCAMVVTVLMHRLFWAAAAAGTTLIRLVSAVVGSIKRLHQQLGRNDGQPRLVDVSIPGVDVQLLCDLGLLEWLDMKDLMALSLTNNINYDSVMKRYGHRTPRTFRKIWTEEMNQGHESMVLYLGCDEQVCSKLYHSMIHYGFFLDNRNTRPRHLIYGLLRLMLRQRDLRRWSYRIGEIRFSRFRLWSALFVLQIGWLLEKEDAIYGVEPSWKMTGLVRNLLGTKHEELEQWQERWQQSQFEESRKDANGSPSLLSVTFYSWNNLAHSPDDYLELTWLICTAIKSGKIVMVSGPFANRIKFTTLKHEGWVYKNVLHPVLASGENVAGTMHLASHVTILNHGDSNTVTKDVLLQNTSNVLCHEGITSRDIIFKTLLCQGLNITTPLGEGIPINGRHIIQCYFRASLKIAIMQMEREYSYMLHEYSDFDSQAGFFHKTNLTPLYPQF